MKKLTLALLCALYGAGSVANAVETEDFKAHTTRNLVNLCSATLGDDHYEAALGFCLGYLDAAQDYHRVITSGDLVAPIACPPAPVTREEIKAVFLAWAKANPGLVDNEAPIQGVMRAAAAKWPCAK